MNVVELTDRRKEMLEIEQIERKYVIESTYRT